MSQPNLPWFSDAEVDDLCTGLKTNAAKVRHLQSLGLTVKQKPNRRPLVMRSHAELTLSGMKAAQAAIENAAQPIRQPNREALVLKFKNKAA